MTVIIDLFNPDSATEEQWERFHRFRKIKHQESNPDDEFLPNENIEANMRYKNPQMENLRYSILLNQKQVGYLTFSIITKASPSFEDYKDLIQVNLYVLKDYRRQGIGTLACKKAVEVAKQFNRSMILTSTDEQVGKTFLTKIGASVGLEGGDNRLDLDKLDWDMMSRWIKEGKEKSPNTTMHIVTRIPDDDLEEYCKIYTETMNQQPFDELELGKLVIDPELMRSKEEQIAQMDGTILTAYTKTNGEISGLTELIFFKNAPKTIRQDLTGVNQKFRGQGLGKWLKAVNITEAKERYPTIEKIMTGNADSNAAMLSINERMGFYKHKERYMSQFKVDLLEKAIEQK